MPKIKQIRWTSPALRDLEAIQDYIAQENPEAAYHVAQMIWQRVETLKLHPTKGRAGRIAGTRELVFSEIPYIVPYRVRGDTLEILAAFHTRRQRG